MISFIKPHGKVLIALSAIIIALAFVVYERITPGGRFAEPQNDLKNIIPEVTASYTDINGNPIDFASFRGKPLVVNSWASWMPFSQTELPLLIEAQDRHSNTVTIIAINRMETKERARAFLEAYNIPLDTILFLIDPTDHFYRSVGGYAMPETIFIDARGVIQNHIRGTLTESNLTQSIELLLAQ